MVGVANNFGGFYNTEFYLHEAKRAGATIEAPCLNASEELCLLSRSEDQMIRRSEDGGSADEVMSHEPRATSLTGSKRVALGSKLEALSSTNKPSIYLGLANIKSLNNETVQLILHERRRHGPFADLPDLLRRVPLHVEQARILIRVGALRFTGKGKPQLLWDLTLLHRPSSADPNGDLFITKVEEPKLPDLQHYPLADAYDELDLLGFPLCDPFSLVNTATSFEPRASSPEPRATSAAEHQLGARSSQLTAILAREMSTCVGKKVEMLGYMIHVKTTTTNSGSYMSFGSFIDTAGDFWDSTQFPSVAAQYPFRGRGVYRFTGIVEAEFGHCSLRAQTIEKLPWRPDPRYGEK
jgi:DNA polymerase-3 subunit alpha